MIDLKKQIASEIQKVVKDLTGQNIIPSLSHPTNPAFGDYASNIALTLFTGSKSMVHGSWFKSPFELAKKITETINNELSTMNYLEKVEAVAPGFINFWLSKAYLLGQLKEVANEKKVFADFLKGKKVMVEFTDPNPFKEFHIGHLYSNAVGEAVSRLLEANGAMVKRANYQGDVGMHVAKALYGLLLKSKIIPIQSGQKSKIEEQSLKNKIKILGEAYAVGAKDYEVLEKAKKEIGELNKKIYDKNPDLMPLYEKGRQWSLEYFEKLYQRLGTKFDFYYFESEVGIDGLKIVKEYLKKGIFEKSQGAIIFPGEKYGLHTRVFVNSLGLPTYEAKDLGLAFKKYSDFKYDQSISVTGNEIIEYFKVILTVLKKINPEIALKIKHLPHGMVKVKDRKMSSRTGQILSAEWLLDEAKRKIKEAFQTVNEETVEEITVGAVKYSLLKNDIGRDIKFSFDESISLEGNSGPYLQYTFARTQSVLRKEQTANSQQLTTNKKLEVSGPASQRGEQKLKVEEVALLRLIYRFPEIIEEAGEKFAPNILCNYLFELAQSFNLFYQKHKILQSRTRDFRLELTAGVGQVLKTGLNLLGISAPEKM